MKRVQLPDGRFIDSFRIDWDGAVKGPGTLLWAMNGYVCSIRFERAEVRGDAVYCDYGDNPPYMRKVSEGER